MTTTQLPGARDGLTMIGYSGAQPVPHIYRGPVTGTIYRFGGAQRAGYVDNRDLSRFLGIRERGEAVFTVAGVAESAEETRSGAEGADGAQLIGGSAETGTGTETAIATAIATGTETETETERPNATARAVEVAAELGVDLAAVTGSGAGGAITVADVRAAAPAREPADGTAAEKGA